MELFYNPFTDPARNLALEELLAAEYDGEALMIWRNAPSIIIGRNQNTAAEINTDFVRERHLPVVRRMTGGGAVYHDLGNINYTILARRDPSQPIPEFAAPAEVMLEVLHTLGVTAEFSGRNDILVCGKKISGSARNVLSDRVLFHATLLYSADLSILSRALRPDPEKIRSKGIKSVSSRVTNLAEYFPGVNCDDFLKLLQEKLAEKLHCSGAMPPPADLVARSEFLAETKYRTWEWNYGTAIAYSYHYTGHFPGGAVTVECNIRENVIRDLCISGDFFGLRPASELAALLEGVKPELTHLTARLQGTDVSSYISGLNLKDFLSLFRF